MSAAVQNTLSMDAVWDPFDAAEGWFAQPRRLLALLQKERRALKKGEAAECRLMGLGQMSLILVLENELWGTRVEDKTQPKDRYGKRPLLPPERWTKPTGLVTLARKCGLSVQALMPILSDGVERGIIARDKRPGEREFRYGLPTENWATAPFYRPKPSEWPKAVDPEEDGPENDGEEEANHDTSGLVSSPTSEQRIRAGAAKVVKTEHGESVRARNRFYIEADVTIRSKKPGHFDIEFGPPAFNPPPLPDPPDDAVVVVYDIASGAKTALKAASDDPARAFHRLLAPIFQMAWKRPCDKKYAAEISKACGGDLAKFEKRIFDRFSVGERLARASLWFQGTDEERQAEWYRFFTGIVAEELRSGGHRSGIFKVLADDVSA